MQNIVITGASGWLGRATIRALVSEFGPTVLESISAFGSRRKIISIRGVGEVRVEPLSKLEALQKCDYLFHYAFLTRDFLDKSGVETYRESNDFIRETVSSYILTRKPKALIFCSSGAVAQRSKKQKLDLSYNVYAEMKERECVDLLAVANTCGTHSIMCTLFSATGLDMVQPSKYAIGSLAQQALFANEILIESRGLVLRKYVDTEDLMRLLIKLAHEDASIDLESGGTLIELSELATMVNSLVGNRLPIVRPEIDSNSLPDDYFSRDDSMTKLFSRYGIKAKPLEAQIANVVEAVKLSNQLFY